MSFTLPLDRVEPRDRDRVGGKGYALARMARQGLPVPDALLVTVYAYRQYLRHTGIGEAVALEINRKIAGEMRWEEMWDAALRIRNLFLRTPLPGSLRDELARAIEARFRGAAVVVRSSAPGEDSAKASFAGLHESFVNVRGTESILDHIRLVWASLWSDAALLYRQELGLDVATSTMAVVVQEIVAGDRSGVAFSVSPEDPSRSGHRGRPRAQPGTRRRLRRAGPVGHRPRERADPFSQARDEGEGPLCSRFRGGGPCPPCRACRDTAARTGGRAPRIPDGHGCRAILRVAPGHGVDDPERLALHPAGAPRDGRRLRRGQEGLVPDAAAQL